MLSQSLFAFNLRILMLLAKLTSYKDMWYYANCDFRDCIIWFLFPLSEKNLICPYTQVIFLSVSVL